MEELRLRVPSVVQQVKDPELLQAGHRPQGGKGYRPRPGKAYVKKAQQKKKKKERKKTKKKKSRD